MTFPISLIWEVIIAVVALFFGIDGGFIRRLAATGLPVVDISLVLGTQSYFVDSTSSYVFSNYPGVIQNGAVLMLGIMTLVFLAFISKDFPKLLDAYKKRLDDPERYLELLV
jgi:hypothetical protein